MDNSDIAKIERIARNLPCKKLSYGKTDVPGYGPVYYAWGHSGSKYVGLVAAGGDNNTLSFCQAPIEFKDGTTAKEVREALIALAVGTVTQLKPRGLMAREHWAANG